MIQIQINFDEFHSFASELSRSADVILLSDTWFAASTCSGIRDVQGYAGFQTYRDDKSGGGVSVFVRDGCTSTHVANFSLCHAFYEFCVVRISLSNNCTGIIIECLQTTRQIKNSRVYNKIE